jgi:hypothetical protein
MFMAAASHSARSKKRFIGHLGNGLFFWNWQ